MTKHHGMAKVAIAHKLAVRLLWMLRPGQDYEQSKYPPAEPVALRLLAPQGGLFATVRSKSKNKSKSLVLLSLLPQHRQFERKHTPGILKVLLHPGRAGGTPVTLGSAVLHPSD